MLQEVLPKCKAFKSNWGYEEDIPELVGLIMQKGKSYAAVSRGVKVSNDKLEKKVIKMKLAGRSNTAMFAQILSLVRQKLKHRGITMIKVGDPDWLNIKEACKLATDFCNEFQLDIKTGYGLYLTMGMNKMKNFSVFKFRTLHSAICNEYEAIQVIERDQTPNKTEECHSIYLANISQRIGFSQGYKDNPEKYQYFVRAKEDAQKYKVSLRVYISAQFQGFDWNNSVPDPAQLVGTKSIDRLQKYAFENNIQIGKKGDDIDFKKIRKHGKDNS